MKNSKTTIEIKNSIDYKLFSYTGSKQKYGTQFDKVLNKMNNGKKMNVKYYIEGFSGSLMSLFHNLKKVNCEYIVINDFNPKLINLYKQIKENPKLVIEGFKMIEEKFNSLVPKSSPKVRLFPKERRGEIRKNENFYKYIREQVNTIDLDYIHSSCLLFVLNHNFNGLYSENKKGGINTSFNWNTKPIDIEKIERNLYNLSQFFNTHNVIFECLDIDSLVLKYNDNDTFIYLDPPYIKTTIQYSSKRKEQDSFNHLYIHQKLLNSCNKYKYVLYSNNHDEQFVSMCDGYENFNRGRITKSNKPTKEILSYKVNITVNNTDYIPKEKIITGKTINNKDYNPVDKKYNLSVGSCFSGLGCPEYVLNELNVPHTSEFVCDFDKYCQETLIKNYNPKKVFGDISKVDGHQLPKTDLYIWGSPCQDLSMSKNNRLGLKGEKSKLFFEGYRILKQLQPLYSVFENVPGLLSSNNGEDFKTVMKLFNELGNYNIYYEKINPVEIGGNTTRKRVFVVLIRKDINTNFIFPKKIKSTKCIKDCLEVGEYKYLNNEDYIPWEKTVEEQRGLTKKDFRYIKTKREESQRVYNINYFSPTITTQGNILINDEIGVRKLSTKELKNIQGFNNNLDLSHLSDTQQRKQLGNTMEVETMKKLILEIVRINNIHHKENIKYSNNSNYQPFHEEIV